MSGMQSVRRPASSFPGRTLIPRLRTFVFATLVTTVAVLAADWVPLFNGKDLTGWTAVHEAKFEAHDGSLRLVRGMGWLRTEKQYTDFVLEVELRPRVERYDSGLFFRAGAEGKPWPTDAWQVNLRRDKWGTLVRGFKDVVKSEVEGPDVDEEGPWSKFRLEVRGRKATLDIDGKRVWEFEGLDAERGYLGIQAEERSFDFRNFRIQGTPLP
jgi:hypothetical protein